MHFSVGKNKLRIAIIVPIYNEAENLPARLEYLVDLRRQGFEILIIDGHSEDNSAEICKNAGLELLQSPKGRAGQMNFGARQTSADILVFLHIDSELPKNAKDLLLGWWENSLKAWGRFDIRFDSDELIFAIIAFFMNLRSRLSGIATGDQSIFIRRMDFEKIGGFMAQPLMEDIDISKRLLLLSRPYCICAKAMTSARRWKKFGVWRTIFLMWSLRFDYWRGIDANELAKRYK